MAITDYEHYDGMSGHHIVTMPLECARDCSTPGQDAGESVSYWLPKVTWHANETELRRIVRETGAWEDSGSADMDTIKSRVLWMAACDWRETDPYDDGHTAYEG